MDQSPAGVDFAGDLRTWETRYCTWEDDETAGQLGQHNPDDTSTRTKITHIEGLGYGIIGSVLSLAYGTWLSRPAALLVMEFGFRARKKSFRYKNIHISISFDSRTVTVDRTPSATPPVICAWYPRNNRTPNRRTRDDSNHTSSSASDTILDSSQYTGQLLWPGEEFWIRGRSWSHRRRQEPHEVVWNMTETDNSITGISEQVRLAAIVTYSEPFRAVVDVKATIGFGLTVRNFPWSQDDPLLFDGSTPKGTPPPTPDFSAITNQELLCYLSDPNVSMSIPQTRSATISTRNIPLGESAATGNTDSRLRKVYRVRGLPFSWSRYTFIQMLSDSMKIREDFVRVHSFAENPYRAEKMAIISFEESHNVLLSPSKKMEWQVQIQLSNKGATAEQSDDKVIQLLFDTHFLGFSELGHLPANPSPYVADIVAIGGLGGHAYGSFKERGGTHMWLEDSLAPDLQTPTRGLPFPGVPRILVYGYDTHIQNSQSFQTVTDLAGQLRMSLRAIRQQSLCFRPIIFIGHSLGGILIKELLILLTKGDEVDQCNFKSTRGALFFGVPNHGIDNSSLISMIETQPNKDLLVSLDVKSPFLKQQAESFPDLFNFRDSIIFSFYETRVSPKATVVNGKLSMNGDQVVLVAKDSAIHSRPWEMDPRFVIAVDRSHSDLVKFERYSSDYEHVLACLRLLLENATDIVSRRFNGTST